MKKDGGLEVTELLTFSKKASSFLLSFFFFKISLMSGGAKGILKYDKSPSVSYP